jgi:hypothetical protein
MTKTAFFTQIVAHSNPIPQVNLPSRDSVTVLPSQIPISAVRLLRIGSGSDNHAITVPSGSQYAGSSVITLPPSTAGATASIENQPSNDFTGSGNITVKWYCPPGGQIRYRVRAYSESAATQQPEEIYITNIESVERLRSLILSRQHIVVYITGSDAEKINASGAFGTPQVSGISFIAVADDALILLILLAAGLGALAITAISVILITGMALGYTITDVKFSTGGIDLGKGEVTLPYFSFDLVPPARS